MQSKIAQAIKLNNSPVAVLWIDDKPDNALQFEEGKWGCVCTMLNAAAKGRAAVFDENTFGCGGGSAGLGFKKYQLGFIEHFLSTGTCEKEGERYKKTPELAREFITECLPDIIVPTKYVVFKPLVKLQKGEIPVVVVFLVNADQISGLVTLANYDRARGDNVKVTFGAGCHSTLLFPYEEARSDDPKAYIGMFDPSARKFVDKDILSFSVPYKRFLEMEANVDESFFITETWSDIAKRM